MSSVLHPVGPEPTQTYWVRRTVVIGAAILVLAVLVALIVNGTSSGSAIRPTAPSPVAAETASPNPMGTELRTPTAHAPSESATAQASSNPKAKASAHASPSPKVSAKPGPVACPADQMRVTLNGKQHLKVKKPTVFQLSLINGSGQTCIASITAKNFELKIFSGTDRIWSTNDCSTAIKSITKKLPPERVVEWTLAWNGRRSRDDCKNRPEVPGAGTYFATAQLDGAKPVQLRMILRG